MHNILDTAFRFIFESEEMIDILWRMSMLIFVSIALFDAKVGFQNACLFNCHLKAAETE